MRSARRAWVNWIRSPSYCSLSALIWFWSFLAWAMRAFKLGGDVRCAAVPRPLGRTRLAVARAAATTMVRIQARRDRKPGWRGNVPGPAVLPRRERSTDSPLLAAYRGELRAWVCAAHRAPHPGGRTRREHYPGRMALRHRERWPRPTDSAGRRYPPGTGPVIAYQRWRLMEPVWAARQNARIFTGHSHLSRPNSP